STSTAAGGALTYNNRSLLITGDMSFAHDLGGLTIASRYDAPLDIIVMNNCGGGIFRFIDSTSSLPGREEYFCADPEVDIKAIAESFGFEYHRADSAESLRKVLTLFYSSAKKTPQRRLLEVRVPAEESAVILKQLLK
ncbi:MAG: 2-succinyl-5-enolpyruvyl-6-hydroxy-3-cyclohexene-1-carboxylic-acid synthase, partial [Muribaculaceae bacterium]|nr:2-succinyl-5-enolpyruvyl-6-hydroxy-3-cyclohexene-1-carboxylic-acid synthase [Muribaculaceae bacterium]